MSVSNGKLPVHIHLHGSATGPGGASVAYIGATTAPAHAASNATDAASAGVDDSLPTRSAIDVRTWICYRRDCSVRISLARCCLTPATINNEGSVVAGSSQGRV